ncbi:hypothetical protein EVAR_30674_1 [Eumeta japonica]|uniref:Uncharacterized protein n=1 Tax=Eumeta variegata TaxID=151549 RepID=A0A4C1VQ47_EUMVA|nr:hypothetical protein EVAR_30674_1 [Eumeta japonica]
MRKRRPRTGRCSLRWSPNKWTKDLVKSRAVFDGCDGNDGDGPASYVMEIMTGSRFSKLPLNRQYISETVRYKMYGPRLSRERNPLLCNLAYIGCDKRQLMDIETSGMYAMDVKNTRLPALRSCGGSGTKGGSAGRANSKLPLIPSEATFVSRPEIFRFGVSAPVRRARATKDQVRALSRHQRRHKSLHSRLAHGRSLFEARPAREFVVHFLFIDR